MDTQEESIKLREVVQRIVQRDTVWKIPPDFEMQTVISADPEAVERAREALSLSRNDKACFALLCLTPIFPLFIMGTLFSSLCGVPCQVRSNYKILYDMTEAAENHVYVIGKCGSLGTVNRLTGKIEAWSPAKDGRALVPDYTTYFKSMTTPWGATTKIRQPVLWVQHCSITKGSSYSKNSACQSDLEARIQAGIQQTVWFVSERDLLLLPREVPNQALKALTTFRPFANTTDGISIFPHEKFNK